MDLFYIDILVINTPSKLSAGSAVYSNKQKTMYRDEFGR